MRISLKSWQALVALGIVAFLVFALFTLPAQIILSRLASMGVQAAGVSGTVWSGQAEVLTVRGVHVGSVEWDLHVLALFTARATVDVKLKRVDGFLETELSATPSGRLTFVDLTGALPLTALPPNALRGGWRGTVNLKLARLVIENGWPTEADGGVEAIDIVGPANKPANLGSYKVTFPPDAAADGVVKGAIVDLGGPVQISGTLELRAADRSYHIDSMIGTRADAPREVVNALQYLGPPDADGRRPFGTEGTF